MHGVIVIGNFFSETTVDGAYKYFVSSVPLTEFVRAWEKK